MPNGYALGGIGLILCALSTQGIKKILDEKSKTRSKTAGTLDEENGKMEGK